MERRNETLIKLAQTGLLAALCFVTFTFGQIKIPLPGGGATSFHVGKLRKHSYLSSVSD